MATVALFSACVVLFSSVHGQCPFPEHCTCTGKTVECKNVDSSERMVEILTSMATNNADTEKLSFIDGEIATLKKGQFQGLGNLQSLTFVNARFVGNAGLNEEALNGLTKLTMFRISMNNKAASDDTPMKFPENFFKSLTALKVLQLDNNRLGTSPSQGVFNGLEGLDILDLSSNNIVAPDTGKLSALRGLKTLNLASNGMTTLSPDVFIGLTKLESLILSGNPAIALNDATLSKVRSLKSLDLSFNQLSEINPQTMSSVMATLETLDLNSNNIETLKDNMFSGLSALKLLNLSSQASGIKTFEPSAFAGLTSLSELDLSRNSFSHLKPNAFEPIAQAHFILKGNRFFCNCEIMPMRTWIVTKSKNTALVCSYPPSLMNRNIADIDPEADVGCIPPVFTNLNERVRGEEGTTVTFSCAVKNRHQYPEMSYTILLGSPLPKNRSKVEVTNSSDANNYFTKAVVFTVKDVTRADNGQIKCTASGAGTTLTATLDIVYGPEGLPLWAIILIVAVVILVIVCVIVGVVMCRKQKYKVVRH
ncbi:leucine-rich repeat-containing protein 70-like [Lineus longissimus]|uniref:leucine-rich repeat-containing protein 70-like n=1 Tax=Lineus longissimus TaxID=88925 RepID=UPI00315C6D3F